MRNYFQPRVFKLHSCKLMAAYVEEEIQLRAEDDEFSHGIVDGE